MSDKDIIRITRIRNVQIENTHSGLLFPVQDILEIEDRGGATRVLDLIAERDITEIDYFVVHETDKTKKKNLFTEYDE